MIRRETDRVVLDHRTTVGAVVGLYALAVVAVLLAEWMPSVLVVPPVVLALSFVPGSLFLLLFGDVREVGAKWVVYALGLSLFLLMLLGLVINVTLPMVGVGTPLAVGPLLGSVSLLVGALSVGAVLREDAGDVRVVAPDPQRPTPLAFALLPLLSVLGVSLLNRTGDNSLLLVALTLVAVFPLVAVLTDIEKWHGFGVWSMAMAILYHDALYVSKTFPGNPVVVRIWEAGRWVPGTTEGGPLSTELLQHGTIFPTYAVLADLNIMTQMVVVNPFFVSFIPVALYVAFRNHVTAKQAFLGASIFMFAHPFYNQYTTAGRAATPVLFLALFTVVISESEIGELAKGGLSLVFLNGVVFTHYGTSYFVVAALGSAFVVLLGLKLLDEGMDFARDNERVDLDSMVPDSMDRGGQSVLSWGLVGFYTVLTFSWFLFTNDQRGFALFPRHFSRSVVQFFSDEAGIETGRTGARLARDYGSAAITYSKVIYVIIAAFIGLGLLVTFVRRFRNPEKNTVADHVLALGSVMLGIFGMTFIVRNWGGGRPMMITFVFVLVFSVVGVTWVGDVGESVSETFADGSRLPLITQERAMAGFALLVGLLLILNSGVASALVLTGSAPSSVPLGDGETSFDRDISMHAWLIDHHEDGSVYGDNRAFVQTDAAAPAIAIRTDDGRAYDGYGGDKPRDDIDQLKQSGAPPGYLLFVTNNVVSDRFSRGYSFEPTSVVRDEYTRNVIYTTGESRIHYFGDT